MILTNFFVILTKQIFDESHLTNQFENNKSVFAVWEYPLHHTDTIHEVVRQTASTITLGNIKSLRTICVTPLYITIL